MNMGPTPKGQFLQSSVAKLEQVGEWLKINGESIYNTEKGPHYLLEWGTCSRKGNTLYYHIFVWPEDGKLVIPGLKTKIKSAYFLADEKKKQLTIIQNNDQVSIGVPLSAPYQLANVLKVELEGIPEVDNAALVLAKKIEARDAMREVPKGSYFLPAGFATVQGDQLQFFYGTGAGAQRENLQGWVNEKDRAEWKLVVERTGSFNIEVTYGSWMESGEFELSIAGQTFSHNVQKIEIRESLKQWAPLIAQYETVSLGAIKLPQGRHLLSIRPVTITDEAKEFHQGLMKLRDVTLTPNQQ